jgi:hypothetical protein
MLLLTSWDKAFAPADRYSPPGTAGMMRGVFFQLPLSVVIGVFVFKPNSPHWAMRVLLTVLATIVVGVVNLPLAFFVCRRVIRL